MATRQDKPLGMGQLAPPGHSDLGDRDQAATPPEYSVCSRKPEMPKQLWCTTEHCSDNELLVFAENTLKLT